MFKSFRSQALARALAGAAGQCPFDGREAVVNQHSECADDKPALQHEGGVAGQKPGDDDFTERARRNGGADGGGGEGNYRGEAHSGEDDRQGQG